MSYPHKCRNYKCQKRRALKKLITEYKRPPKCRICGSELRYDRHKQAEAKRMKCICDGYWFPHRKGSEFCDHYKGVKNDEYWERYYARAKNKA